MLRQRRTSRKISKINSLTLKYLYIMNLNLPIASIDMLSMARYAIYSAFQSNSLISCLILIGHIILSFGLIGWLSGRAWNNSWNPLHRTPACVVSGICIFLLCVSTLMFYGGNNCAFSMGYRNVKVEDRSEVSNALTQGANNVWRNEDLEELKKAINGNEDSYKGAFEFLYSLARLEKRNPQDAGNNPCPFDELYQLATPSEGFTNEGGRVERGRELMKEAVTKDTLEDYCTFMEVCFWTILGSAFLYFLLIGVLAYLDIDVTKVAVVEDKFMIPTIEKVETQTELSGNGNN